MGREEGLGFLDGALDYGLLGGVAEGGEELLQADELLLGFDDVLDGHFRAGLRLPRLDHLAAPSLLTVAMVLFGALPDFEARREFKSGRKLEAGRDDDASAATAATATAAVPADADVGISISNVELSLVLHGEGMGRGDEAEKCQDVKPHVESGLRGVLGRADEKERVC